MVGSRTKDRADMNSCWTEVISLADNAEDGAHIFAYHSGITDRWILRKKLYDRHRLVWMNIDTLKEYGSDAFWNRIQTQVDFEAEWRRYLRPKGPGADSFLPQSSFTAINAGDMWDRIRHVDSGHDELPIIVKLIRHFRNTHHRKGGYWQDARGIQFRVAKAQHAYHSPYGITKFTFRLPDGHHYDVKGEFDGREFRIKDVEGNLHRLGINTNIDCHGSVRGGK